VATILVIEDNPQNLKLMAYLLTSFGHAVESSLDGVSGLDAAIQRHPDLVLSDILMPGIDGYELARRFKADERMKGIPLIAVTALAMVGDRDRILSAGFDGYISKPIDPLKFVTEVEAFLPRERRSP
jgi:CheY-like chemotaxis protein